MMKRLIGFSNGQTIVLYAGMIAALLGATALCTDVALMYVNHIQLQKGVDIAAIAGANYMLANTFSNPATGCSDQGDDAKKAACTYASNNGLAVDEDSLTITEPTSTTIKVSAQRTNLPYYFGKALGLNTYSVSATSTAQVSQAVSALKNGMFPVGLQCTNPCTLANMDPGQTTTFGSKFVNGLAPGNWQWLDVNGNGDSILGSNLQYGAQGMFSIGDNLTSDPGNNANSQNARTGLAGRLASCPTIADPCANNGNPRDIPIGDPCLVAIPAVDYRGCTGNCVMSIEGFALIYIEPNTTTQKIQGCFVQAIAADSITSSSAPNLGALKPPSVIQ